MSNGTESTHSGSRFKPTLPQRLESELIGNRYDVSNQPKGNNAIEEGIYEAAAFGANHLIDQQLARLPALSHSVLQDMLAMLPEQKPAAASVYAPHYRDNRQHDCDYTLQVQLNNELNKGYNQAVEEIQAALTAYCIGEGGKS